MTAHQEKQAFIERYKGYAMEQQQKYGIPASVTLAQAIIESRYGTNEYTRKTNNFFGIHAPAVWIQRGDPTMSFSDSKQVVPFTVHGSAQESFEYHSKFLLANSRQYGSCYGLSSTDADGWARGICEGGYAARPADDPLRYYRQIMREINDYDLRKYDQQAVADAREKHVTIGYARGSAVASVGSSPSSGVSVSPRPSPASVAPGGYCMPLDGKIVINSEFGHRHAPTKGASTYHTGVDIQAHYKEVRSMERGTVVAIKTDMRKDDSPARRQEAANKGGNYVIVRYDRADGKSYFVSYCHLDEGGVFVKKGDTVEAGQVIGRSGSTGNGTGPHLHLTVKVGDRDSTSSQRQAINPLDYMAEVAVRGNLSGSAYKKGTGEDLLASRKSSVDADTPTPADVLYADNQKLNTPMTEQQQANLQYLKNFDLLNLEKLSQFGVSKDMLAWVDKDTELNSQSDIVASLLGMVLRKTIGNMMAIMESRLQEDGIKELPAVDESIGGQDGEGRDGEDVMFRGGINPIEARNLAMRQFDAELGPEQKNSNGIRLG